jgi:3-methylcrotonyl-CoA carboxylase alpha subunit
MTTKIKKILIANRGEIACRVIKTARKMGIRTVAVYSDADRKALHVRMADEGVHIGPSPAAESYLVIDKIIDACKTSGADAVHPGYGFLSENPEFARRLKKEKIIFIGPSPESMEAMGLKDAAKKLMEKADVPVTPGYHGKDQGVKILKAKAGMIGYPVLIKAVAGGGGKGMRKVDDAKDFEDALGSCQREAKSSFGDDRVLIEKYILSPRHIEVQVFGDTHGNVVHMFERDCSLQRRHQKVIEEAPAPGMTDAVRKAMTDAAVKAAQAVDYVGAGTVEFIVDGSGKLRTDGFWFMEMNTRLQVEHPVTEMITGLDLVEWQIRVAQGEKLPKQKEIEIEGHAVEARIYAEDPSNDFLPSVGEIKLSDLINRHYRDADHRVDVGVDVGDQVSIFYDPMIAKVIGYGDDREEAIEFCKEQVFDSGILGVKTNADFISKILTHPDFIQEKLNTGFIPDRLTDLIESEWAESDEGLALAACRLSDDADLDGTPFDRGGGWRLNSSSVEKWIFMRGDGPVEVSIAKDHPEGWHVVVGDNPSIFVSGRSSEEELIGKANLSFFGNWNSWISDIGVSLKGNGKTFTVPRFRPEAAAEAVGGGNAVISPMPGKILDVRVKVGDAVTKGDKLIIMEAMKMEMSLEAPRDGIVETVECATDDLVTDGAILLSMKEE